MISKSTLQAIIRFTFILIVLTTRVGGDFSVYDDLRPHVEATDPSGYDADDDKGHHLSVDSQPFHFLLVPPPVHSVSRHIEEAHTFAFTAAVRLIPRAPPV